MNNLKVKSNEKCRLKSFMTLTFYYYSIKCLNDFNEFNFRNYRNFANNRFNERQFHNLIFVSQQIEWLVFIDGQIRSNLRINKTLCLED